MWKDEAIYQMALHKIPASITLAQGILESGDGNSRLAREGNNHFGIKCHEWQGKVIIEDDETKSECFRKYDNARDSYEDHSAFLQRKRYESLFALETDDYKGWAKGLKQCGYATNPKYPQLLIGIIEEFQLHKFDEEGARFIRKNELPERPGGSTVPAVIKKEETIASNKKTKHQKGEKATGDERATITITNNREVQLSENHIKYVVAKAGDTDEKIAEDFDTTPWLIRKYNDLENGEKLKEGQVVYLQPKRNRASEKAHTVQKGENMWSISQKHGIKMKRLYKLNLMPAGAQPKAGEKVKLRK